MKTTKNSADSSGYLNRLVRHIGRDKSPVRPWLEIKLPKGWLMIFYTHRPCVCWSDDGSIPQKGHNKGRWIIGNWRHYWRPF